MTVSDVFGQYLLSKSKKGLKDVSLDTCRYCIGKFLSFAGSSLEITDLTQDIVDRYILSLYHDGLSRATVCTYIRYLKLFLCFVAQLFCLPFQPDSIEVPKSPKKKVRFYSPADLVLIFQAIQSPLPWITARNRVIVALMLDSGLRQCEIVSLLHRDISFSGNRLLVHGKGDKDRYCLLGNVSACYLQKYLNLCPYSGKEYVFCSLDGSQITGNAIRLFISRLAASLPFDLSSHKLRHNFATNYVIQKSEAGQQVDAYTLKLLMGHESISTTEGYIHCAMESLAVKSSVSYLDALPGLPRCFLNARNQGESAA